MSNTAALVIDKQLLSIQHFISTAKRSSSEGVTIEGGKFHAVYNGFVLCEPCLIVKPHDTMVPYPKIMTHSLRYKRNGKT